MAALPPNITGNLANLDPVNNEGDREMLTQVQEHYNTTHVNASKAQQERQLGTTLDRLGLQLTTQAISASQQLSFSGKSKDLLTFLSDVEQHVFLATGRQEDDDLKRAVYQSAMKTVSDFI